MSLKPSKDIALFDDARRTRGRNGKSARADLFKEYVEALNAIGVRYRPIYTMVGGSDLINTWGTNNVLNATHLAVSPGCSGLRASFLVLPSYGQQSNPQQLRMTVGAEAADSGEPVALWDDTRPSRYPLNCHEATRMDFPSSFTQAPNNIVVGNEGTNSPQIRSGLVFEKWNLSPDPMTAVPEALPTDTIAAGQTILGQSASDAELRSMKGYRDQLRRIYAGRRLVAQWSAVCGADGTADDGAIRMTVAPASYRYLFDQTLGVGGVAPTRTKRGMTLPLKSTAPGIRTRIRIYFRVLAAMESGSGGEFAVYNLGDSGDTLVGPTAMTNPISVTGSTYQWYGMSATFNPNTDTYFQGNTVRDYDRVVPCARATSGVVKIRAFGLFAYHSIA